MTETQSPRRVAIRTLGCKVNSFESELILSGLIKTGHWSAEIPDQASDLYIINSCTVTREADRQTRQVIRRCVRDNPNARVVVTGCYAEMDAAACADINGVDLVVGNAQKLKIPHLIPELDADRLPRVLDPGDVDDAILGLPDPTLSGYSNRTRAFIQIQQGCDQGCTFCIIHKARGASRSLELAAICAQIGKLEKAGFKEFVLCGVDLGAWGQDFDESQTLHDLLTGILEMPGDFQLRIGSLDPVHISDELIDLVAREPRLAPHLHISMQSGHTLILKRMKRRYTRDLLHDRVARARALIDDLVIGADIMAGFPTEEDEHFAATLESLRELRVAFPHVFPYSERPGTPAARIPRQVPKDIRSRRARLLREAGTELLSEELGRRVGGIYRALVERGQDENGRVFARLENYLPVSVAAPEAQSGDWIMVRLRGHNGHHLDGEILQ